MTHIILDHSIVGQDLLTNFEFRKDREYAACRICGDIFQSRIALHTHDRDYTLILQAAVAVETHNWREKHNHTHTAAQHLSIAQSGRFLTPEAAHKLAPYGIAPVSDFADDEITSAMREANRAPCAEVES